MRPPLLAGLSLLLLLSSRRAAALSKRGFADAVSAVTSPTYCADLALFPPSRLSWTYSWHAQPPNSSCAAVAAGGALSFEPMRWGAKDPGPLFTASATHLLGFNEPNGAAQADAPAGLNMPSAPPGLLRHKIRIKSASGRRGC